MIPVKVATTPSEDPMKEPTASPRLRLLALAAVATLVAAVAPAAPAAGPDPEPKVVYEMDVLVAPVCLDGAYPMNLELVDGTAAEGVLDVTTSPKGKIAGTWTTNGLALEASGTVRFEIGVGKIKLLLRGPGEKIKLSGDLYPVGFAGVTKGKGFLAPGDNTFTLYTATASPGMMHVEAVLEPGSARITGSAWAALAGDPVPLKAVRTTGANLKLSLKGGGVSWTGSGPPGSVPGDATVTWSAKGWGGRVSGDGLPISAVPPPSVLSYDDPAPLLEAEEVAPPNAPTVGGGPVLAWSVSPDLPAGLVLDPDTGLLSGTPASPSAAADYEVTASNLAGSTTATVTVAVRGNRAYSWAIDPRTLTDDDYRHFLGRTHFGVKGPELAAVKAAGLPAYLDDMLVMQSGTAIETAAFQELVNETDPPGLEGGFPAPYQMTRWWQRIMMETDRPFQEVMAFFWHDHMPTSYYVLGAGYTHFFVDYANLLRHKGTGNFRELMLDMSRSPAMLVYLDGVYNSKYYPNENYAREFWELFTLGVDNGYTQADIAQGARAFTGYQFKYVAAEDRYTVAFNPNLHDTGTKTFFGATIPGQPNGDDYAAVVDITLAQRPVDKFIAKKIFEHFCYVGPPQELVDTMAAQLRAGDWELKPFLKSLFRSEAFFSNRSRAGRAKSPVEYNIGLIRTTGLTLTLPVLDYFHGMLGQRPGEPPTVNGWPLGTFWFSSASMVHRTNAAWYVVYDRVRQASVGINVADILPPVPQRTATAVLDTVAGLMRVKPSDPERASLLDYLNTMRQSDGTIVASPFDGSSQAMLDERVRGLIYILAQHPDFQVK
jgi:uncharacterized protein (DUF1800 family)